MTLAVMLSGQAYISLVDRIDHAQHHAHYANPLAGDVAYAAATHHGGDHHVHHDGTQPGADHNAHATGDHRHATGMADHQHGDAALVFLAAQSFVLWACPSPELRCPTTTPQLVSFSPRGPDHPPKMKLEIRV